MQKIGILGFGVVGKSVLSFLCEHVQGHVAVWDARSLSADEQKILDANGVELIRSGMNEFVAFHDVVVASPGIDTSLCAAYSDKIIGELDLFAPMMHRPTVAITGSLGKTTITKLLTVLAQKALSSRTISGGNIGVGMLDLIKLQDTFDLGFLELSSFQLESNKSYAPDVAVWTNFYPNHLDRHKTVEAYFQAKFNLFRLQRAGQHALFSFDLMQASVQDLLREAISKLASHVSFYTDKKPTQDQLASINLSEVTVFYADNGWLYKTVVRNGIAQQAEMLCDIRTLPSISYLQNWVCVLATLYLLGAQLEKIDTMISEEPLLDDHHHRLEHCGTVNGVDFYNDSKSTLIQATQAAVVQCAQQNRAIILILGGLGKGADRSPLMEFVKTVPQIRTVYCYGPECHGFVGACVQPTLESIMEAIQSTMQPGDIVLFSPSGASFDFYKNYGHRGDVFKSLVSALQFKQ